MFVDMSTETPSVCGSCGSVPGMAHLSWCEAAPDGERVSSEGCFARVMKGGASDKVPREMLVVDTGQPQVPPLEMRHPKSAEEVDELYRWTIRNGIVDHHGIDAVVLDMPAEATRRCAAKMVADFPEEVVALIKERDIRHVTGHVDSDLDSITATYLTKRLVETRDAASLPSFIEALGNAVNRTDYGRVQEADPEKLVHMLPGVFMSLKSVSLRPMNAEIGAIWRSGDISPADKPARAAQVSEKYHKLLIERMFAFYNACVRADRDGKQIDFDSIDFDALDLPPALRATLNEGILNTMETFEAFNKEFESAERHSMRVVTKTGDAMPVTVLLFPHTKLSPLVVTNLSYTRMPPETIVAAFAGAQRSGGDYYDIGIKPETLDLFDITFLEIPLNQAEAEKRAPLLAELKAKEAAGTLEPQEAERLTLWTTLRQGKEYLGHGDPTVAVAGGSLVAASNTSLLTPEDFRAVILAEVQKRQA